MATIDGALYEVEVKPTEPHRFHYQVMQDGKEIGRLHKANEKWFADEESCLMPDDIAAIGKAIDKMQEDQEF